MKMNIYTEDGVCNITVHKGAAGYETKGKDAKISYSSFLEGKLLGIYTCTACSKCRFIEKKRVILLCYEL
jgi:hypothetical protein